MTHCRQCKTRQAQTGRRICHYCRMGNDSMTREDAATDWLRARLVQDAIRSAWCPNDLRSRTVGLIPECDVPTVTVVQTMRNYS